MPFTPEDWEQFLALFEQHPEWRAAFRKVLFGDRGPWEDLVRVVGELAEAQRRTEERLEALAEAQRRTEERLEALAEAQRRTEERLGVLEQRMAELAEAQRRTEERLEALAEAQRRTEERLGVLEQRMAELAEAQRRTEERVSILEQRMAELAEAQRDTERRLARLTTVVGRLQGAELERRYRERAPAYFAPLLRRIRALSSEDLARMIDEAEEEGLISAEGRGELLATDVVVTGVSRADGAETYLAVEVFGGIGAGDVARAVRRAKLLEKLTGKRALAVVAGEGVTNKGVAAARESGAIAVIDGRPIEF